jgi:hypothetical protein
MVSIQMFNLSIYHDLSSLEVYAPDYIEPDALLNVTKRHYKQGFAWTPHYIFFNIALYEHHASGEPLEGCAGAVCEAYLEDALPTNPIPDALRAIQLPFEVGPAGLCIQGNSYDPGDPIAIDLPAGSYGLLFEYKLRDDPEYLQSEQYAFSREMNATEVYCRFTFSLQANVEPKILKHYPERLPVPSLLMEAEFDS